MWSWLLGGGGASAGGGRSRFSAFLGGKREFSLANMQHLHAQLLRSAELPDHEIVELLRVLSEFLIYSDQNRGEAASPTVDFAASTASAGVFFDYFCEKNILALLVQIAEAQPSVAVQVQLLQTLSILVQNISTRTSLYYLLSNNYVNKLLESPFAYDADDDVRDWFVTLLKALSLRLNEETVQFFFDSASNKFPLYAQALRFGRCSETMVKVAVKTLMLNVLKVQDDRVRRFLLEYQKMAYFADVVEYANELALKIQGLLNIWTPTASAVNDKLEEAVDAYIDHCYYLQDILDVNLPELCYKVGDLLFRKHVKHLLAVSLLPNCNPPPQRISTRLALYLLTRLLGILEHAPLVNAISFLLLSPDAHERTEYSTIALGAGASRKRKTNNSSSATKTSSGRPRKKSSRRRIVFRAHSAGECNSPVCYLQTRYSHGEWPLDEVKAFEMHDSNWFRQSLLTLMESADEVLAATALLVVLAVMNNAMVDHSLLREMHLMPHRLHHHHHHRTEPPTSPGVETPVPEGDEAAGESSALSDSCESSTVSQEDAKDEEETGADAASTTTDCTSSSDAAVKTAMFTPSSPRRHHGTQWLIERALELLNRCTEVRVLSAQLCVRLLLDLAWDRNHPDTNELSADQLNSLVAVHSVSTHQVMQSMRGAMADVDLFLYVVEDEYSDFTKSAFPIALPLKTSSPYEFLVPLQSPSSDTSDQKTTLHIRHPVNEMEVCRKAMRTFLIIRKLRELVDTQHYEDDQLGDLVAFRHPHTATLAAVTPSRYTSLTSDVVDLSGMVFLKCVWREQRFLSSPAKLLMVLNPEALAFVERDESNESGDRGFVRLFAPIHRVYASLDAKDEHVLHFTIASASPVEGCRSYRKSSPKDNTGLRSWHASVLFENAEDCKQAKANVDLSRAEVRAFKLLKVEEALSAHVQITTSQGGSGVDSQRGSAVSVADDPNAERAREDA